MIIEHRQRLDEIAKAYADRLFEDFQDPEMRGPYFEWRRFPTLVSRIVYSSVFLSFTDEEWDPDYKLYAKYKAFEYAQELIDDSDLA